MSERRMAAGVLTMNTLEFTACFAVWMMNGVLITYLVDNKVYAFDMAQMGWLIGVPVLTGSLFRLPVGVLTDKHGGRPVFAVVMLLSAAACFLTSYADGFWSFLVGGLGFGLAGTSFAVGIAYTSVWFPRHRQGTALGIFGAGIAGVALTSLGAHIYFQANIWAFTVFVFLVGILMGIGKAAVYKYIPEYLPEDVGVVGGIVGVLGGLGGFFCPILFGYRLEGTGIWTTCWMFFFLLSMGCLLWLQMVVRRLRAVDERSHGTVEELQLAARRLAAR